MFFLRHDVDASWQRALKLAHIEREEGVTSTYFILFHSDFFNVLEPEVTECIRRIRDLGHHLGLHFDPNSYPVESIAQLTPFIELEKKMCQDLVGVNPVAISLHNPDVSRNWIADLEHLPTVAGMVNVYCQEIRANYSYLSDSNGYWRFRRLFDVLEDRTLEANLHILIHPEWWTPEPLLPRERIDRCIDGRALALHRRYDAFLAAQPNRVNVGVSHSPLLAPPTPP